VTTDAEAEADRITYHGPNGAPGTIGLYDDDGKLVCVGCHWCCPDSDYETGRDASTEETQ
jgi:hypothetical protein